MIALVRARNLELASKLENSQKELQSSVEQKMKENSELLQSSHKELQSSVEQMKESNDQMREKFRRENEKLVEQFRLETQKITQDFSKRLQVETSKLSHQVRELQCNTEKELTVVQGSFRDSVRRSIPRQNSNPETTWKLGQR
jgi:hypothetical protein